MEDVWEVLIYKKGIYEFMGWDFNKSKIVLIIKYYENLLKVLCI